MNKEKYRKKFIEDWTDKIKRMSGGGYGTIDNAYLGLAVSQLMDAALFNKKKLDMGVDEGYTLNDNDDDVYTPFEAISEIRKRLYRDGTLSHREKSIDYIISNLIKSNKQHKDQLKALHEIRRVLGDFWKPWSKQEIEIDEIALKVIQKYE